MSILMRSTKYFFEMRWQYHHVYIDLDLKFTNTYTIIYLFIFVSFSRLFLELHWWSSGQQDQNSMFAFYPPIVLLPSKLSKTDNIDRKHCMGCTLRNNTQVVDHNHFLYASDPVRPANLRKKGKKTNRCTTISGVDIHNKDTERTPCRNSVRTTSRKSRFPCNSSNTTRIASIWLWPENRETRELQPLRPQSRSFW